MDSTIDLRSALEQGDGAETGLDQLSRAKIDLLLWGTRVERNIIQLSALWRKLSQWSPKGIGQGVRSARSEKNHGYGANH